MKTKISTVGDRVLAESSHLMAHRAQHTLLRPFFGHHNPFLSSEIYEKELDLISVSVDERIMGSEIQALKAFLSVSRLLKNNF